MKTRVLAITLVILLPMLHGGADSPETEHEGRFHMLKQLPTDPEAYQPPVAALVEQGIPEKYGEEEWAAVVFANEIHQHVGILTVVGAKMAVRARELLDAPVRTVKISSETGPEPPQACALDGMQAAIGSTFGQKLISAPPVTHPQVAATFVYGERSLRLALKPEYQARVGKYIAEAIASHGNLTHEYFEQIEENCYEVWAEFDRREIFDVQEIPGKAVE
jgi:pyrimidine-specific ribonucleoside hydrolase